MNLELRKVAIEIDKTGLGSNGCPDTDLREVPLRLDPRTQRRNSARLGKGNRIDRLEHVVGLSAGITSPNQHSAKDNS